MNKRKHTLIPGLINHLVWFNGKKIYTTSGANAPDGYKAPDNNKSGLRNRSQTPNK